MSFRAVKILVRNLVISIAYFASLMLCSIIIQKSYLFIEFIIYSFNILVLIMVGKNMETLSVKKAYNRMSFFYNILCNTIFSQGRKSIVSDINSAFKEKNAKILEVGVGTGLSLPFYDLRHSITGIDLSEPMLSKAKKLVDAKRLDNVETLLEMDAENMTFADHSFDVVVAMYVVSVVPNLQRFIDEVLRVCKPGGKIYIVNHFSSDNKFVNTFEKNVVGKMSKSFGLFDADFPLDLILRQPGLELLDKRKINLFGYWRMLHFKKNFSFEGHDQLH